MISGLNIKDDCMRLPNGDKLWYSKNHKLHRINGPAVERTNGTKEWWVNGKLHRIDAPAVIEYDGTEYWAVNGKFHRIDGPAAKFVYSDNVIEYEYWLDNKQYSEVDYWKELFNRKLITEKEYLDHMTRLLF